MDTLIKSLIGAPISGLFIGDVVHYLIEPWGFGYITLIGVMVVYPVLLVIAYPVLFILRKFNFLSIWSFQVVGFFVALLCWAIVFWPVTRGSIDQRAYELALYSIFSGVIATTLFYYIGVSNNAYLTNHSSGTPNGAP